MEKEHWIASDAPVRIPDHQSHAMTPGPMLGYPRTAAMERMQAAAAPNAAAKGNLNNNAISGEADQGKSNSSFTDERLRFLVEVTDRLTMRTFVVARDTIAYANYTGEVSIVNSS